MPQKNEILHYGVKGMKWGVRKDRSKNYSDDYKRYRELKKRDPRSLSNSELREYLARAQLNTQYSNLNRQDIFSGRRMAEAILIGSASTVAANYVKKYMGVGLQYAIGYAIGKR